MKLSAYECAPSLEGACGGRWRVSLRTGIVVPSGSTMDFGSSMHELDQGSNVPPAEGVLFREQPAAFARSPILASCLCSRLMNVLVIPGDHVQVD